MDDETEMHRFPASNADVQAVGHKEQSDEQREGISDELSRRWVKATSKQWSEVDVTRTTALEPDVELQKRLGAGESPVVGGASCAFVSDQISLPRGKAEAGEPRGPVEMADLLNRSNFDMAACNAEGRESVNSPPLKDEEKMSCFTDFVGQELLPDKNMNYMKPCCIHIYATLLHMTLTRLLKELSPIPGVNVYVGSSTLLGVARHSGIIPNDHDQDIYVIMEGKLDEVERHKELEQKVRAVALSIKEDSIYVGDAHESYVGSYSTNAKIDIHIGHHHKDFAYFPYFDGVHMCASHHTLPLAACNYFGWPVPCPKQPALYLRFFHRPDAGPPYSNPRWSQKFRDNELKNLKEARGTHERYAGKNDTELDKLMLPCQWSGEMGATSLLVPSRAAEVMAYAEEVIESGRCLRNTGWPSLITSCVAGVWKHSTRNFDENGLNACKRDLTETYTPWSALYPPGGNQSASLEKSTTEEGGTSVNGSVVEQLEDDF